MTQTNKAESALRLIKKEILYMKATGIVRRIDDLGRVVIPKEIRRTMRLREGASLEIYTDKDGGVIFRKYSPIGEFSEDVMIYCETVHKATGNTVAVVDKDTVIAAAGSYKRELTDKKISKALEDVIEGRTPYIYRIGDKRLEVVSGKESDADCYAGVVFPISVEGDIIGAMLMLINDNGAEPSEVDCKLISTAAQLLARQMES